MGVDVIVGVGAGVSVADGVAVVASAASGRGVPFPAATGVLPGVGSLSCWHAVKTPASRISNSNFLATNTFPL
jgi:hypothetical protein